MRQYVTSWKDSRPSLLTGTRYQHKRPTVVSRLAARTVEAFRSPLNDFLGAAMVFSLAMLVAALYMSGKGTAQRRSPLGTDAEIPTNSALHDMMLSMLAATFSIFPAMILYAMQRRESDYSLKKGKKRIWVHRAVLVLIWMLEAAEVYACLYGNFDSEDRDYENAFHMENCDWRGPVHYWSGSKSISNPADSRAFTVHGLPRISPRMLVPS